MDRIVRVIPARGGNPVGRARSRAQLDVRLRGHDVALGARALMACIDCVLPAVSSGMLRRLRRKLREIEYYSATRRRTPAQRLLDTSMFLALGLAVLSTWIADSVFTRSVAGIQVCGKLGRERDPADGRERLAARLTSGPNERFVWGPLTPVGEFCFTPEVTSRGLPLPTTRGSTSMLITLRYFDQLGASTLEREQVDAEVREAIRAALATDTEHAGVDEALAAWTAAPPSRSAETGGRAMVWIANMIAWWLAWMIALALAVHLTRGGHWLTLSIRQTIINARHAKAHSRRQARCAGNLCPECGYDMRGLEFSERCPECGAVSL